MNLSLEGKNAIICGSTQGIGYAIAEELAIMGANCTLIARNESQLENVINGLDTTLRQLHTFKVADFTIPDEVQTAVQEVVSTQPVHILVNNTGGPAAGPIIEAAPADFLAAFTQHLICNHLLVQAVVEGMKSEGYGRIINIISTSVKIPLNNLGVSNTIRGAVASWAKTLANELGQYNITVNNVLPGFTQTARLESLIKKNAQAKNMEAEAMAAQMMNEVPLKRFGTATEIAAVAAFFATPAASFVNGVSIPVDGGRTGSI